MAKVGVKAASHGMNLGKPSQMGSDISKLGSAKGGATKSDHSPGSRSGKTKKRGGIGRKIGGAIKRLFGF
jgi:hypothetical protein